MIDSNNHIIVKNIIDYTLYDEINIEKRYLVSWQEFEEGVKQLHASLTDFQAKEFCFDGIYGIPRGGLCLAVKLSYLTNIPLITDHNKITQKTLIVDGCVDSGKTLVRYKDNITAVFAYKKNDLITPTFFVVETDHQINFCWEGIDQRN